MCVFHGLSRLGVLGEVQGFGRVVIRLWFSNVLTDGRVLFWLFRFHQERNLAIRHMAFHPFIIDGTAHRYASPRLTGSPSHWIYGFSWRTPLSLLQPFVNFGMSVRKRKTAGAVVIAGREVAPLFRGAGEAGVKSIGGVTVDGAHAVGLFVKNDKYVSRAWSG